MTGRLLKLAHDFVHLSNPLAGSLCHQKFLIVPARVFANLVQSGFDGSLSLGLLKALEVMTIRVVVGFVSQQIVESEFRKGNALIHGIQIFRIHGGNQCGDQVKSLGIGKGFALILEDFSGFVLEIIGFAAVRSNLAKT